MRKKCDHKYHVTNYKKNGEPIDRFVLSYELTKKVIETVGLRSFVGGSPMKEVIT